MEIGVKRKLEETQKRVKRQRTDQEKSNKEDAEKDGEEDEEAKAIDFLEKAKPYDSFSINLWDIKYRKDASPLVNDRNSFIFFFLLLFFYDLFFSISI